LANGASSINLQNPLAKLLATGQIPPDLIKDPAKRVPAFLIDSADNYGFPLRYFGHTLTDDGQWKQPEPTGDYSKWWWMDMLHYRKTGTFASTMLKLANSPVQKAYASGYITHVAGDICGHPFINAPVGGPFRNHAYRHMVLESLADTWLWNRAGKGDIINAGLHDMFALSKGDAEDIANLIVQAMKRVYLDPMLPNQLHDRYPLPSELTTAYGAMSVYLELSTTDNLTRPEPPPDDPGELLKEIQDLLSRNFPSRPPSWNQSDPMASILAVLGYLWRGIVFLAMLSTLDLAVFIRFGTVGFRWLLYLLKLAIYMIVSGHRMLLALMGWGYAGKEDFETFGFLEDLITVGKLDDSYPRAGIPRPKPPYYWMVPPRLEAPAERETTKVAPVSPGSKPDWIVSPANRLDTAAIASLATAATPRDTRQAEQDIIKTGSLAYGNAVDFSVALRSGQIAPTDLDLDGDRGFGYRPWEVTPPKERYV
jgi:hypothetical protein